MEQIEKKMMDMGMQQFMDKSRRELSMSDETYLQDNEDEKELERKYMELDLEKSQRLLVNDYSACMRTVLNRYADICYMAGIKDAVKMMNQLGGINRNQSM